jgi:hypothetical protein
MRLRLYSSIGQDAPNLVSLQAEDLDFLPTVLVCPLKEGVPSTIVRSQIVWESRTYVVLCDLARPIRRQALRAVGTLDQAASREIMDTFLRILARD